jgi:hypothetical protein
VFAPEAEKKLAELQAHVAKPGSPTVAQGGDLRSTVKEVEDSFRPLCIDLNYG